MAEEKAPLTEEERMAENVQKVVTGKIEKNEPETEEPGQAEETEITLAEEKVKEITDKVTEENKDKPEEEVKTLVDDKLNAEKETQKGLAEEKTKTIEQITSREENKDKSEEDILGIYDKELQERSLSTETTEEEPKQEVSQKSFDELLSEKTDGKYTNIEDLIKQVEEPATTFASERIKFLNDLEEKGINIEDVMAFDSLKVDDLDPSSLEQASALIKHKMRIDEPGITERELEYEFNKIYDLSEPEDGEEIQKEDLEMTKLRLIRQGRLAKEDLLKKKKELQIPKVTTNAEEQKKLLDDQIKENEKLAEQWKEKVGASVKDYKEESFSVEKDVDFKYEVPEAVKKQTEEAMAMPNDILNRYVQNGTTDINKFRREMTILNNYESIIRAVYSQGKNAGVEYNVSETTNLQKETTSAAGSSKEPILSPAKTVAKAMRDAAQKT